MGLTGSQLEKDGTAAKWYDRQGRAVRRQLNRWDRYVGHGRSARRELAWHGGQPGDWCIQRGETRPDWGTQLQLTPTNRPARGRKELVCGGRGQNQQKRKGVSRQCGISRRKVWGLTALRQRKSGPLGLAGRGQNIPRDQVGANQRRGRHRPDAGPPPAKRQD